jgi:hypothetical protein
MAVSTRIVTLGEGPAPLAGSMGEQPDSEVGATDRLCLLPHRAQLYYVRPPC